jgi:plasmid stabilization system protein ParE
MKYTVSLTSRAEHDREKAFEWYAENYSVEFATRWWHGVTAAMHSLANMPERCHIARESRRLSFEPHELLYGTRNNKHRILFRIQNDEVLVLHIRHTARRDLNIEDLA